MDVKLINNLNNNKSALKTFTLFSVSLFLLIMFVSAFFIVPKFNSLLDNQHEQDVQSELAQEAALFTRFIVSQQTIVQDLAAYPSLAAAVMLGDSNDLAITELFNNSVIGGKKSRLVLQDIAGTIVIKTDNTLYGNYARNQPWLDQLLNGEIAYHFQLLRQDGLALTFKVSVPVFYNSFIEGVLSSEITVPLKDIFITQAFNDNIAFRLTQGDITVNTGAEHIEIQRENSLTLAGTNIVFSYVTDDSLIYQGKRELENVILLVLLFSFTVSFLLFAGLSYRSLTQSEGSSKVKLGIWRVYFIPIFVGIIGIAASISAFMIASNLKNSVIEKELIFESKQKIKTISKEIAFNLQILDAVKSFYKASNYVSRQEFNTFVTPLLSRYKNIQAIEWVPYVAHEQRQAYEQKARADGVSDFMFTEKNEQGELISAKIRDSYFPVYYVAPIAGNEKAMGYDLASNKKRLAAINKAKISADKIATAQINLVQATDSTADVLVFNAIFDNKSAQNETDSTRKLHGFALLVLNVGDIVADTTMDEKGSLYLHVEDITEKDNI